MLKRGKQKDNGITLIALVITIIILFILAGVSITTLTGENGILRNALKARENTEIAEEKEAIGIAYTEVLATSKVNKVSAEDLQTKLKNNGYDATVTNDGETSLQVTFISQRTYVIDENGNISQTDTSNYIVATMTLQGEKVETPPLPSNDFSHIEGTVDTGYVIQDNDGNEFVWIPVDKNQKIHVKVTSKENIEHLVLTDPFGDEIISLSDIGTNYDNTEIEPTINGKYVLEYTIKDETYKKEMDVYSLYAIRIWEQDRFTEEIAKKLGYDNLEEYFNNTIGLIAPGMSVENYISLLISSYKQQKDNEDYTNEVNRNGGFYVGRYEASYENGNVASKVSKIANQNHMLENGKLWNAVSQTQALSQAKSMYTDTNFTSSLLTGSAWDRIVGWLYETGNKNMVEVLADSTNWGNYSTDSNKAEIINTGSVETYRANNIYDLAGNLAEWTTEINDTFINCRGGAVISSNLLEIMVISRSRYTK